MNPTQLANELAKLGLTQYQSMVCPQLKTKLALEQFISSSDAIRLVKRLVTRLALMEDSVVIQGESGTGKEIIANALHGDRGGKFIGINCTSLPDYLLESELFGHVKGAFTGADSDKVGLLEHAGEGTVFLDEIGDMPLSLQAKLLRVLQERHVRRVGSNVSSRISCRFIAATHRNLLAEADRWERTRGRRGFRPDLYWRLGVYTIDIPPLRERSGDIDELLDGKLDVEGKLSGEERDALRALPLKGNVRELEALVKRALLRKELGIV
jgi:transcriptional regulator with GAF, ATPase, and Fis domain